MYKIGDRVIVTKSRAGWLTGKGTWGFVGGYDEAYNHETESWEQVGVELYVHFYRKKGTHKGTLLFGFDRYYITVPFANVDLYSNVVDPLEDILIKIKLMSGRQKFKFQGVENV